jgi:transcriptional regulator with XRE-family HTH domain
MDARVTPAPTARTRDARLKELALFLRSKRMGLQPQAAGLVARRRRRAPGLLREEVADLAGVSVTWYTWLEQARATNPSARVLDGLAAALQLQPAERQHLFRLARPDLVAVNPTAPLAALSAAQQQWLQGLAPHPAYALNATWDVIAWNEPAARVFGGFAHLQGDACNVLHRLLLDPVWRELFVDWEEIIARAISQFRAMRAQHLEDPRLADLVAHLTANSPHFARLWPQRDVGLPPSCVKTLRLPQGGTLNLNYATVRPQDGRGDVVFIVYTPADAPSAQRLRRWDDGSIR